MLSVTEIRLLKCNLNCVTVTCWLISLLPKWFVFTLFKCSSIKNIAGWDCGAHYYYAVHVISPQIYRARFSIYVAEWVRSQSSDASGYRFESWVGQTLFSDFYSKGSEKSVAVEDCDVNCRSDHGLTICHASQPSLSLKNNVEHRFTLLTNCMQYWRMWIFFLCHHWHPHITR
jgi:hypothetical protein